MKILKLGTILKIKKDAFNGPHFYKIKTIRKQGKEYDLFHSNSLEFLRTSTKTITEIELVVLDRMFEKGELTIFEEKVDDWKKRVSI